MSPSPLKLYNPNHQETSGRRSISVQLSQKQFDRLETMSIRLGVRPSRVLAGLVDGVELEEIKFLQAVIKKPKE